MGAFLRTPTVATVLALWAFSVCAAAAHDHHDRGEERSDEHPCPICVAIHDVPVLALPTVDLIVCDQVVVVCVTPWFSLVPEEVLFDRPLARGPPSLA
jgi:hypothetical protein